MITCPAQVHVPSKLSEPSPEPLLLAYASGHLHIRLLIGLSNQVAAPCRLSARSLFGVADVHDSQKIQLKRVAYPMARASVSLRLFRGWTVGRELPYR